MDLFCVVWSTAVCLCGAVLSNCSLLSLDARASPVPALTHWLTRVTYARTSTWQLEGNDAQPWYCPICRSKCCCAKSECTVSIFAHCGRDTHGSRQHRMHLVHKMCVRQHSCGQARARVRPCVSMAGVDTYLHVLFGCDCTRTCVFSYGLT